MQISLDGINAVNTGRENESTMDKDGFKFSKY